MRTKRKSKEERALLKAMSASIKKVAAQVRAKIKRGLDPSLAGSSITWGASDTTYVRLVFYTIKRRKTMLLEVVIGNFMLASVSRGAGKPGIKERDVAALDKFVKEAPGLLVDGFKSSVADLLSCGDPLYAMQDLMNSSSIGGWKKHDKALS